MDREYLVTEVTRLSKDYGLEFIDDIAVGRTILIRVKDGKDAHIGLNKLLDEIGVSHTKIFSMAMDTAGSYVYGF